MQVEDYFAPVRARAAIVDRTRAAIVEAVLVAAELWRLSVFDRGAAIEDARAADARLARLEAVLVDAERLVADARADAELRTARAERTLPMQIRRAVQRARRPIRSTHDLARMLSEPVSLVDRALAKMLVDGELVDAPSEGLRLATSWTRPPRG